MKMNLKKSKKVKGMTLVEIIIALFVFTVMAMIVAQIGRICVNMNRTALDTERKTNIQAPLAEARNVDGLLTSQESDNLKVSVTISGKTVNITANTYTTKDAVTNNNTDFDVEFVQYNPIT